MIWPGKEVGRGRGQISPDPALRRGGPARDRPSFVASGPLRLTSTAEAPPGQGFDLWHSVVCQTFVPLEVHPANRGSFRGEVVSQTVGPATICRITADAHHANRTRRLIALGEGDRYHVTLQVRGRGRVTQDGREALLTPGDLTIKDTTRPYTLNFDGTFQVLVLMFGRDLPTLTRDQMRQVTASRIPGTEGTGALVSPLLLQLAKLMPTGELPLSRRLAQNILDLLETVYCDRLGTPAECPETLRRSRLLAIQAWIDRHLDTVELCPEVIAAANHISVRYLHRLFQDQGTTVSRWTRDRRLERCRHDLGDPVLNRRGVSVIAARWGFLDAASFSRTFKAAYGESPREYRARMAPRAEVRVQAVEVA